MHEPPYTVPYVRWCERAGAGRLPPTRLQSANRESFHVSRSVREFREAALVKRNPWMSLDLQQIDSSLTWLLKYFCCLKVALLK